MRILALLGSLIAVAAASAAPPGHPSHAPASGPPPAWAHTASGDRWLGWGSYCWTGKKASICADYMRPSCTGSFPSPRVPVRIGEVITLHFGFRFESLSVGENGTSVRARPSGMTARVSVRRLGVLTAGLQRHGSPAGDAVYVACLVRR
jgi:hypothetical protein